MNASSPAPAGRQVLRSLWQALHAWRARVLLATLLLVLSKLAAVGVPALLKAVVDRLTPPPGGAAALVVPVGLLLGYALLRFASTLFTELRDLVFARVGKQVTGDFSAQAFAHLLAMSPRFHAQRHTGALIREVERGIGGLGYLLGAGVFTVVPTAVEFLAVLVIIVSGYGAKFVLVIAATMLAYSAWTAWKTRDRVHDQRRMNSHDTHAHALLVDTLLNYEAVKTHGRESAERVRYAGVLSDWVAGSVKSQRTLSALHLGQAGLIALGVAVVMLTAGADTAAGRMSLGDLVLINAYLLQVFLPLNTLGFVFRETRDALLNTETLFKLLRETPEIVDAPDAVPLAGSDRTVRFEQVDFGYAPERPLLRDFSLEIPHGRTVAVVGSSGSGKSTLARLLLRLYDPVAGQVSIGGQPLVSITQQSLRETVGVVPQEPLLFNDTIAYNIAYGRPGATQADILAAAVAAQADEFIQLLPDGYETLVGERGARLSGGEKQRIAIARAFLKNSPILVLDEATSALDTRAERAIQGALDRIARHRTALIIAHRLSTVVDADEIIVMDRGRLAERGRHETLLARQGLYAQLWELQRQQQQAQALERRLVQHPVNLAGLLVLNLDGLRDDLAARHTELFTRIDMDVARVLGDASRVARIVQLACQFVLQGAQGGRMEARLAREPLCSQLTLGFQGPAQGAGPWPDTLELRSLAGEAGAQLHLRRDIGLAEVQVDFPLPALAPSAGPAEPAVAEAASTGGAPLRGLRLLCVDDDEDALTSLVDLLVHDGAEVEAVASGREALERLAERPQAQWPDVLVCDIALGAEDGHAVVRSIRALEARRAVPLGQRLPAVALTGMAQPEDRLRALAAGFQRHLAKPVAPAALVQALRQLAG
jgi:ATP-binding cassette subfamily B protein